MEDVIEELKNKFIDIREDGWIESYKGRKNNFGRTFEKLIGKDEDNLEFPDYNNIEIKTRKKNAKNEYLTLFSYKPESVFIDFVDALKDSYGYPDRKDRSHKVLNQSVYADKRTWVGSQFQFLLKLDKEVGKIFLCIFDAGGVLVEKEAYWDINIIREKIKRKLNYLALVEIETKIDNDIEYYKYNKIVFYKLKEFDSFMQLFESGRIRVNFKIGYFSSGPRINQTHNRGISFDVNVNYIEDLFEKIIIA